MPGGWNRVCAGVPLVMPQAGGPGHVALSDDNPGEVIAVPLEEHSGLRRSDGASASGDL